MKVKEVDVNYIDSMKRSELQKLAKQAGIKANMKTDDLISALQQYHSKKQDGDPVNTESTTQSSDHKTSTDASSAESGGEAVAVEPDIPAKVTRRRGRARKGARKAPVNTSMDTTTDSAESNTDVSAEEKTPETKVKRGSQGRGGRTRAVRGNKAAALSDASTTDSELDVSQENIKVQEPSSVSPADKPAVRRSRSKSQTPTAVQVSAVRRGRSKSKTPTPAGKPNTIAEPPKPQTPLLFLESPPAELRRSKRSKTPTTSDDEKPQSGKRGSSGPKTKKIKRDTFEIEKKEEEETAAMGTVEDKAVLEAEVMAELKKRVDAKMPAVDQAAPGSTSIPRFSAYLQKSSKKPVTPGNKDWDKVHNKSFKKMESIDDYLARKRKRTDMFSASVKKAKLVADEAKATVQSLKTKPTPQTARTPSSFTPGVKPLATKTPGSNKSGRIVKPVARRSSVRKTPSSILKATPVAASSQAKPKLTAEKAVKFRPSGLKPPTKLVLPALPSIATTDTTNARKSVGQHATPFKFTAGGNTTLNSTLNSTFSSPAPKPTFDLKASIQKPLNYKPHSGALRPLNEEEEKKQKEKLDRYLKAKQMYKRPVIKTRDDRRKKMQENRGRAKDSRMLARRGIEC